MRQCVLPEVKSDIDYGEKEEQEEGRDQQEWLQQHRPDVEKYKI